MTDAPSHASPDAAAPPPSGKPRRRRWLRALLTLVMIVVITVVVLFVMAMRRPGYWHVLDGKDPKVVAAGEHVEQVVSSMLTHVRPEDVPWTLPMSDANINDWLAARMPAWLANQGIKPEAIAALRHAMVHTTVNGIEVSAQPAVGRLEPVLTLTLKPLEVGEGTVWLNVTEARVGSIPLPLSTLRERIAAAKQLPKSLELRVPLKDGREVDVVNLTLADGSMTLTCETRRARH